MIVVALPLMIVLFIVLLLIFYKIQRSDFCPACKYLQCLPYTPTFCADQPGWAED